VLAWTKFLYSARLTFRAAAHPGCLPSMPTCSEGIPPCRMQDCPDGAGLGHLPDGKGLGPFPQPVRQIRTESGWEQAATELHVAAPAPVCAQPRGRTARSQMAHRPEPSEPERGRECPTERRVEYVLPDRPAPGRTLHEPAAPRMAKEPNRRLPSCRRRHGPVSHRRNPTAAAMLANPANRRSRLSAAQLTGATILSGCRSCPAPPWISPSARPTCPARAALVDPDPALHLGWRSP
jgi:hypothetical protein